MQHSVKILVIVLCILCWANAANFSSAQSFRTVALTGDLPPGMPAGSRFAGFDVPTINNDGRLAFRAALQLTLGVNDNNNSGIWSDGLGPLSLIAREGTQAPGTAAGANFSLFGVTPF